MVTAVLAMAPMSVLTMPRKGGVVEDITVPGPKMGLSQCCSFTLNVRGGSARMLLGVVGEAKNVLCVFSLGSTGSQADRFQHTYVVWGYAR